MALAVAILWSLAAVGAGSAALSAVGLRHALPTEERPVWAFAIGLGVLGWITFFLALAGLLTPVPLLALSLLCASGLALLRGSAMRWSWPHLGPAAWLGLGALALVILFDAVEALVPPFNIDALAYHIALPKRFAEINGIDTVARLRVGAPPGLLHMTYIIPLVLGGEGALKLCLALLGWAPGLLIYVLARRYLSFPWALAATLIFLTVPAVIFAGGTAQVEPTAALFVLAGAFAVAESLRTRSIGFTMLAGFLAGAYAGSKYIGLLFCLAAGLTLMWRSGRLRRGALFAAAALLVGGQWYAVNWWTTGDPVFPALHVWLSWEVDNLWNRWASEHLLRVFLDGEDVLPRTLSGLVLYPFLTTFSDGFHHALRRGPGIFPFLMLPLAAWAAWTYRQQLREGHPLGVLALLGLAFFLLFFFVGRLEDPRYWLPALPLFMLPALVAAVRLTVSGVGRRPLVVAVATTIALQIGIHAVFTFPLARALAAGGGRDAMLARLVPGAEVATWLERTLDSEALVLHDLRQLNYLMDTPHLFTLEVYDSMVLVQDPTVSQARIWARLREFGVTHIVAFRNYEAADDEDGKRQVLNWHARRLSEIGCARKLGEKTTMMANSRTLPSLATVWAVFELYRLTGDHCGSTSGGKN